MNPQSDNVNDYLVSSEYIDWEDDLILQKAKELKDSSTGKSTLIEMTYHFVKDEIVHTYQTREKHIAIKASDVLREGCGVCWSKANLLAALLRANDIPTGICYQKFHFQGDEGEDRYCIHAVNAVYIGGVIRWIRLDTKGEALTVGNECALDTILLSVNPREDEQNIDFDMIYCEPAQITVDTLENNRFPFVKKEDKENAE